MNIFRQYAETKRIYLKGGNFYKEGEIFRQPELAATFARLQRSGPNEFYEGETARLIVADMKRNNGLMTMEDLRGYVAKERDAGARQLSWSRNHFDAAAFFRRRGSDRDAQHSRRL